MARPPSANHPRRSHRALLALVTLSVLAGCQHRRITVEMNATEGRVDRSFATNRLDRTNAARVAELYGSGPVKDAEVGGVRFDGSFGEVLPSEVGNRNGIAELAAELGTARFYFEAFGRTDTTTAADNASPSAATMHDEWAYLNQRMAAGELWSRLFGQWAEKQIPDSGRREAFRVWVETTLVPGANNIMLQYGSMQATAQSQRVGGRIREADEGGGRTEDETFWRQVFVPLLLSLAVEGGDTPVLTPEETHTLLLLSSDGRAGGDRRQWSLDNIFLEILSRQVRRFRPDIQRVTVPQLFAAGFAFYLYATGSRDCVDLLLASPAIPESDKQKLRNGDRSIPLPPPYGIEPLRRPDATEAEVRLKTGGEPYATNGLWDPEHGQVVFKTRFYDAANRTIQYQPIFYAAWTIPARDRQETLFGSVILEGEALADYCLWEQMLTPDDRIAWSETLLALERDGTTDAMRQFVQNRPKRPAPRALIAWLEADEEK